MRKTSEEIEEDVFKLVKAGNLTITGGIYRQGMRPFNSKAEDIVVSFLSGADGQKQIGILNINAYVPDVDNGSEQLVKNISRCKAVGIILKDFKESLMTSDINLSRSGYKFLSSDSMITTFEEPEISQHFVNLRLKFEYLTV